MNKRELRIGNWVKWIGKPCKVDLALLTTEFDDCKTEESSYVEPIELTEQMLLDNGFEYVGEHEFDQRRCFLRYRGGDCIIIFCTPNHTDFRMTIRKDSTEISEFPCQYLHELQNLYYEINKKEIDFKF